MKTIDDYILWINEFRCAEVRTIHPVTFLLIFSTGITPLKKLSLLHKPHIVVLIEKMALFSVNNTGITYSGSACFQACRSSYICYFLNLLYMAILPDKAPWQKPSVICKFSHDIYIYLAAFHNSSIPPVYPKYPCGCTV